MSAEELLIEPPKRILIPRLDTIGDIILLEGFLESLLQRFPEAGVTLLVRQVYADLASLFPEKIEWLTTSLDPHRQLPSKSLCCDLLGDLGDGKWDLILFTAYNRTWADDLIAAGMAGARCIALGSSFNIDADFALILRELGCKLDCPYHSFVAVDEKCHEIEKYQMLWAALGGKSDLPEPTLAVNEHQKRAADEIIGAFGLRKVNLCVCSPAGTQKVMVKTWRPDYFGEVIAWMESKHGIKTLITGHRSEMDRISEVARIAAQKGAKPELWLGRDGEIPLLAAILDGTALYLGNDTGPMHIAAALNTPVVAIFGGGTWPRFIPRGARSIAISGTMPCYGCGWDCLFENAPCMELVSVDDVKQAVDDLLEPGKPVGLLYKASVTVSPESVRYIEGAVKCRLFYRNEIGNLVSLLRDSEVDRANRLAEIERIGKQLAESEADRAARLAEMQRLWKQIAELASVRNALPVKILIKLGLVREKRNLESAAQQ
jgi:ADP-heptose:LPS heptosyltransferase